MAKVIVMPKLGYTQDTGSIAAWLKAEGDTVERGEALFDVHTDKSVVTVESSASGTLLKIALEPEVTVPVLTPVCVIGEPGEDAEAALKNHKQLEVADKQDDGLDDLDDEDIDETPAAAPAEEADEYDYDVVVIGSGPGGYETAIKAAQKGLKTAIVEEKFFGGTCLNVGCIPTKVMIHTADIVSEIKEASKFAVTGVDADKVGVDMKELQKRKTAVVNRLTGGVQVLLKANKVTIENGKGSLVDAHTVKVGDKEITSANIIIATGSSVFMPPFIAVEGENNILTSNEALDLDHVPETVAVIGGGVIGVEFAYLLNKLGAKVTVLELMDHIIPMVDKEISALAQKKMEKDGIVFNLGAKVKSVKDNHVYYELDGKEMDVAADAVLMAVGRIPNTEGLNAEGIGIEFNKRAIAVDEACRTNIPNIYAIGDVNGKVMLAHTASHEGMVAVADILGEHAEMNYDQIPSCIYINPEISAIGLTEEKAKEVCDNVKVGRFPMMANGKSLIAGAEDGMAKVILDADTGEILGVHIYADRATEMIGEMSVAIANELTAEEIIHSIHPHPTVNEAIGESFMAAWYGKAINNL
jgi:dihydrolipoamide dehydrogenase